MSATDQTASEMFQSLTGFDEISIKKEFKADIYKLGDDDLAAFTRALIFVDLRRGGTKDSDAFRQALEMRQGEVTDYFAGDPEAEPAEGDDLGEA